MSLLVYEANTAMPFQPQDLVYEILTICTCSGMWLSCKGQRDWKREFLLDLEDCWVIQGPTEHVEVHPARTKESRKSKLQEVTNATLVFWSSRKPDRLWQSPAPLTGSQLNESMMRLQCFLLLQSVEVALTLKWKNAPQIGLAPWRNASGEAFYHIGLSRGAARPCLKWRWASAGALCLMQCRHAKGVPGVRCLCAVLSYSMELNPSLPFSYSPPAPMLNFYMYYWIFWILKW